MENIDDLIKTRSAFNPPHMPEGFDERSDALLSSLRTANARIRQKRLKSALRLVAAVILSMLLLAGVAMAALTLSGSDYFKQLYQNIADGSDGSYGYMNTAQLGNMVSSTVGTVIDTDDFSVEVLGVLISGTKAQFDILVTAKNLDTVLYDTGIEPLMNYRFHTFGLEEFYLLEDGVKQHFSLSGGTIGHIYSDTDDSLAPNQYIVRYSFFSDAPLINKSYSMTYRDFGYFDFDEPDQFVELYEGEWSFNIAFDPADDTSRTVLIGQSLSAGEYDFIIESVEITPLTCMVIVTNGREFFDNLDDRWPDVWDALRDKTADFTVKLRDGTNVAVNEYDAGLSGGAVGYEIINTFKVPISVEDVASITIGGMDIPVR